MDAYPFDLVLAVMVASATIFLGFLPTTVIRSGFFAREALRATAAWIVVATISPLAVMHYPFILAVLCFVAWWNFQRDDAFTGKIWLSIASGLGISIGVMVILAVTPGSLPMNYFFSATSGSLPGPVPEWDWTQALCLASLYLGGAITGLAYVGYALCREAATRPGLGRFIQNSLRLLLNLTLIRAIVVLIEILTVPSAPAIKSPIFGEIFSMFPQGIGPDEIRRDGLLLVGASVCVILPALAFLARRAAGFSSRLQPTRLLVAIIVAGLATEVLARIELL